VCDRVGFNEPVTGPVPTPTSSYRLAPALGARLVGRSLVTLAALVLVAAVIGPLTGAGWRLAGSVTVAGLALAGLWAWYLLRVAWAVRLTDQGYAVRLLRGVGATGGSWGEVAEVLAVSRGGRPCLVLRLRNGMETRLPMAALAGEPDSFAHDVRRRLRDAHTPTDEHRGRPDTAAS
jgi:hypothetical protein